MKLLNIDEVAEVTRTLKIKGTEYPVLEGSVGQFLDANALSDAASKAVEDRDGTVMVTQFIDLIRAQVPTLPVEVIREFSFSKLRLVLDFVQGGLDDEAKPEAPAPASAGEGEAGK